MIGRLFRIKKSIILRWLAVLFSLIFATLVYLSISVFQKPELWFFSFCLCLGLFEIAKSFMFNLDSAFYFGILMTFLGIAGYVFIFTDTAYYVSVFILSAISLASLFTYSVTNQKFHLIIAFSLFFVDIYTFLYLKNLITLPIFIAFIVGFLLLLIVAIILSFFRRD